VSTNTDHKRLVRNLPREVGCGGKHAFESHAQAIEVCQRNTRHKRRRSYRPYRCGYCNGWHLGSKPKGVRRGPLPFITKR
jgi:hypothetical protein